MVNETEAARVRAIFALCVEHQGLLPVLQELARRLAVDFPGGRLEQDDMGLVRTWSQNWDMIEFGGE